MREETARAAGMSREELRRRVTETRAAQGLPPTVEDPTTLQRIADLFLAAERSQKEKAKREKRGRG